MKPMSLLWWCGNNEESRLLGSVIANLEGIYFLLMNQHDQLNLQFTYIAHQLIQLCFKKKDK